VSVEAPMPVVVASEGQVLEVPSRIPEQSANYAIADQ
jgi:hypothetical protein